MKKQSLLDYWLISWLGCCLILGAIFYLEIRHKNRIDKIFENYYIEMKTLTNKTK